METRLRLSCRRLAALLLLSCPVLVPAIPAQAQDIAWGTVPSPNAGFAPSRLNAVAVLSGNDVWAAGSFGDFLSPQPLVERWDGTMWSVVANPEGLESSEILGVAAVSADDIWFVGGYTNTGESLVLHWDGESLTVVPNPNPGTFNRLYAVAALAADDVWAVGEFNTGFVAQTLVEHWDGASWQVVPSPTSAGNYTTLLGVAAVSAADVWAVGEAGNGTFAIHWDGARWRRVRTPSRGSTSSLKAVAAGSAADVWAVGESSEGTLTEHWDGLVWRVVPSPSPGPFFNDLNGVVAIAADDVWAVGFNDEGGDWKTLALHWDGTRWRRRASLSPDPTLNVFYGASASGADDVWAVGETGFDEGESGTLVERWDGASWNLVPSANAGTGSNLLYDLSARAPDDIWAVGEVNGKSLTLRWNAAFWSVVPSPDLEFGVPLQGVVAVGPDDAWAVGSSGDPGSLDSRTVTMHWDGTSWEIVSSPNPGGNLVDRLDAVDGLASDDVWAVGEFWDQNLFSRALILHWDGSAWSEAPNNNCGFGALSGITVLAAADVWAVGDALTCHFDGSSWDVVPSPQPRAGFNEIGYPLEDVSGVSSEDVWAVGARVIDFGQFLVFATLIEHWDGDAWTADFDEPGVTLYGVEAVLPNDVWAVGTDGSGTLILNWDGVAWNTVPSPQLDNGGILNGIDSVAEELWAAGTFFTDDFGERTLIARAPSDTQGAVAGDTDVAVALVSWFGPVEGSTETNAFGEYGVAGLPAGEYFFTATAAGCAPDSAFVTVVAGTTVIQDFELDC